MFNTIVQFNKIYCNIVFNK